MADKKVDEYIESVIKAGDEGSALLAAICAPTLKREYVEIVSGGMNNVTVARIPQNYLVIAHSTSGDSEVMDPKKYAQSLVERLLEQSKILGSEPIAISNIIDASTIDKNLIEAIGTGLVEESKKSDLAIMNGELACLGIRVNCPANISGTMIGMIPKTHDLIHSFIWQGDKDGVSYAVFDPEGMGVYMNCDGVGTKNRILRKSWKTWRRSEGFRSNES